MASNGRTPELRISFKPKQYSSFVIEELTFNPFIKRTSSGSIDPNVDLWCELSIRRQDLDEGLKAVPSILLQFGDKNDYVDPPTTAWRAGGGEATSDANFLMHSDIWYSFARVEGRDWDFMESGYNKPVRILYECGADGSCMATANWISCGQPAFMQGAEQREATRLLKAVNLFHKELLHASDGWRHLPSEDDRAGDRLVTPADVTKFSPVRFAFPAEPPRARFAVRRWPWPHEGYEPHPTAYGVGYGGTARATANVEPGSYELSPLLFAISTCAEEPAYLGPGEALRFWFRWSTAAALVTGSPKGRVALHHIITVEPALGLFNSFIRVPVGLDALPGGITEIRNYAVPPRLFFLWDAYLQEQCFSYHRGVSEDQVRTELRVAFDDRRADSNRLARIFLIGLMLNVSAGIAVSAAFEPDLGVSIVSATVTVVLGVAAVLAYHEREVRMIGLLVGALIIAFAAVFDHPVIRSAAITCAIAAFALGMGLTRPQVDNLWSRVPFVMQAKARRDRRAFLNSRKGDG